MLTFPKAKIPRRSARFRTGLVAALLLSTGALNCASAAEAVTTFAPSGAAVARADKNAAQRELYKSALQSLASGDLAEYKRLHAQLDGYALLPYLEYAELSPRLANIAREGVDYSDVDNFLDRNRATYIGNKFEREWITQLVNEQRSNDVIRYHNPANTTVELTCQAFKARLEAGDTTFFPDVAKLWNVATSQPNACDPVFAAWLAAGNLTPEIAWQRFSKTLKARQQTLARFVSRQMQPREQALAELYLQVDSKPELLNDQLMFSEQSPEIREMILHGLQRLAQADAKLALNLWSGYQALHNFEDAQQLATPRYIAQRLLLQGYIDEAEGLLIEQPELISESLVEWILRDALAQQDWMRVENWYARLPAAAQASERWQYWHARALAVTDHAQARAEAQAIYESLTKNRSFYGFMAADLLNTEYALIDKPVVVSESQMLTLYDFPAISRAHELYFVGDEFNARKEWDYATAALAPEQIPVAGKLAESWGWYLNGIQAMIKASYWDDLQLRFPLAYGDLISTAASRNDISPLFLYAIARQESAFIHDAQSAVGAMGLMQLMPTTGEEMALGEGMIFSAQELLRPDINITLGSRYLAQMLQQFDGNHIVAAAAYNAGPNRVRQWLRDEKKTALPYDIWIETIPFAETRGYVQNVLAYVVIYGYRTGKPARLLTGNTAATIGGELRPGI